MGAAERGLTGADVMHSLDDAHPALQNLLRHTEVTFDSYPSKSTIPDAKNTLARCIKWLNDDDGWSREAIAEWVGWLIDERDYDLHVYIEQAEEEDERCPAMVV
jgi:hypothetical protein